MHDVMCAMKHTRLDGTHCHACLALKFNERKLASLAHFNTIYW